jgi:DNA mismatch repair protein MutL
MLSSQTISLLPDYLANQIAAGEVVQRPESIIKELVENALDAGASSILVIAHKAGKQAIHVIDNGSGMSKEDLMLSIQRHATSKIKTSQDLERIATLGFRGEALASITAVAHLEIKTKRNGDEHGWSLTAEPLQNIVIEPCIMDVGTQVIVKNMFFNVPARKKFLKSDLVEFRHISETMHRSALGHPECRFTFYDGDALVFDVHASNLQERINKLYGKEVSEGLLSIMHETPEVRVSGFIGLPHLTRQSRAGQHFFLNHRPIMSRSLAHAVFQPYEHLIEKNMHPFFVVNLDIDPTKVDVNVHPQKHEVKFEYERGIYNAIHQAVGNALSKAHIIPEMQFREQIASQPFERLSISTNDNSSDRSGTSYVNRMTGEIINPVHATSDIPGITHQHRTAFEHLFGADSSLNIAQPEQIQAPQRDFGSMWQLHAKYIFIQTFDGVMIVDQHAAHERIIYEKSLRALNIQAVQGQTLLFPINVNLLPEDHLIFLQLREDLEKLGFRFTGEGDNICVTTVPFDILAGTEHMALQDIITQYREYEIVRPQGSRDNIAASMGCKAAIKAGHVLSESEMKSLISDLFACEMPGVCPHGRPIILEMQLREFDRRFGRTS